MPPALADTVRRHEAELARLRDYGFELGKPGFMARLDAGREAAATKYAADCKLSDAINLEITPVLMSRYVAGTTEDRQEIRALLKECRNVRNSLRTAPAPDGATRLRDWLTLLAMKDGDPVDWRDEILALDELCGRARQEALDVAKLLREAAEMASDASRGDMPSFRATLLARAEGIERPSRPAT